jgi:xylulokinase
MAACSYLLGLDIGTSSIKASVVDISSGKAVASRQSPATEMSVEAPQPGFAEQDPELWWKNVCQAIQLLKSEDRIDLGAIEAIGLTYQMHGLVLVDSNHKPVRPAIIWCDSRSVGIGERAYRALGDAYCREHLLNSPGNFTASKLRWVQEYEPQTIAASWKLLLPGDFIGLRLSAKAATTPSGLSEMILWDYQADSPAKRVLDYFEAPQSLLPEIVPTFGVQGQVSPEASRLLGLRQGIPISYRAGDQPNNAFSLKVLNPGELAATAGTSGVIYGVGDKTSCDSSFRVNTFLHVNHSKDLPRLGTLLCINGTGILYSWLKREVMANGADYSQMNQLASSIALGSDGLVILPYGNGAERSLGNWNVGASILGLDLNRHARAHLLRAAQEGIVCALTYGLEIMEDMGVARSTIRAGDSNMFLSPLFCELFSAITNAPLEIYTTDGAQGAARGAGIGAGIFSSYEQAFQGLELVRQYEPEAELRVKCHNLYQRWKAVLESLLP